MRISLIITVLGVAALWGCTAGAGSSGDAAADDGKTTSVSPGKPLHPIQVHAVVDGELKAGVETNATLIVDSARPAYSIEVEIQPQLATVVSSNRFEKRGSDLKQGAPLELGFRFRPASDAPQPLKVLVRVTDITGRVLTRDVTLSLGGETVRPAGKREIIVDEVPEPAGDAVVPARQEIRRGN